ncbi:AzlD domain-containing protein [Hoyosella sp. YIM 151337]|uniref:AzlD domain-containing protein n=1 Tax=Hoyosella sp. YIM 151337 TaxID=2992742 RepID=UPI0022369052|nr:AzlD domain-containing protein [Hoyosella sp. YIM 151337]MCW4355950.1 AzlD domain-containing protein [Hoyosella sp. YIM 151337]
MTVWFAVIALCAGCYFLKFAGLAAPAQLREHPVVQRFAYMVPVALLAALVVVQTFSEGQTLVLDWPRTAGVGTAAVALALRAPFLVVLIAAAAVTAGLRWAGA